jgi:hypothetical protein
MSDDTDEGDEGPVILMEFNFECRMVRMVGNLFVPSHMNINAEVMHIEDSSDEDIEVAFTKIKYWLENVVGRCIAFNRGNSDALQMLLDADGNNRTRNVLMVTPEDPSDEHIAAIMQAKLTALSGGALLFGTTTVCSDNVEGLSFSFVGDSNLVLPDMSEWIGERSFFENPWWSRDDASTLDVVPPADADLTKPPAWSYSLDFIRQSISPPTPTAVVVRPAFRPTVIQGGKGKEES